MLNLVSNRRTVLAGKILLLGAIMLMTACGNESYQVQDLRSLPRQAVSERIYKQPVILSTDTLLYDWGKVGSARIDDAGNIYVLDRWIQAIVKFNAEGRFVTQLGQKGPGPGEFTSIQSFDVRGDGTVFASDFAGGQISIFDPNGRFIKKGSTGVAQPFVAVNNENLVTNYFFGTPVFRTISDDLDTQFKFGQFGEDPYEISAKINGQLDGYAHGTILVSWYTGLLFGYDLDGNPMFGTRTIEAIDIDEVRWGADGGLETTGVFTGLINVTDSNIYILSSAFPEVFGIDVYSTKTGQYEYSFPLPDQECGPRYIDENEMISGCIDGEVLRSKIRFE